MPHADHRQILCGMKSPPDPQHRPAALDKFGLVATGITALVAKRILETKDDAMSVGELEFETAPEAQACHAALHDLWSSPQTAPALSSAPHVRIVEPVEEGRRRVQPPSQGRPQR
jgi:hypothetical protein